MIELVGIEAHHHRAARFALCRCCCCCYCGEELHELERGQVVRGVQVVMVVQRQEHLSTLP